MKDAITLQCSVCNYSRTFDYGSIEENMDAICDEGWSFPDPPDCTIKRGLSICVDCRTDHHIPYYRAIAKGIELLDQRKPGWRKKVDKSSLDMGCPYNCVIGQVYGEEGYFKGLCDLGFKVSQYKEDGDPEVAYGFELPVIMDEDRSARYRELTEAWLIALS